MKRILPIFLLIGCGSTGTIPPVEYSHAPAASDHSVKTFTVFIDPSFSEEDKDTIFQTLNEWMEVGNGYFRFVATTKYMDPYPDWIITQIRKSQLPSVAPGYLSSEEKANTLAFVDSIPGHKLTVVRERFLSQRAFRSGLLHEEAHLLGAVHQDSYSEKGAGLMNGKFNLVRYRCVDYWTVKQIALVHNLPMEQLSFCSTPTQ